MICHCKCFLYAFNGLFGLKYDKGNIKVPRYWPFVRGIYRSMVNTLIDDMTSGVSIEDIHHDIFQHPLFHPQARLFHCSGCLTDNPSAIDRHVMNDSRVYRIPLNDERSLHEVMVPTCSYRMGTRSMGYGAAVFRE